MVTVKKLIFRWNFYRDNCRLVLLLAVTWLLAQGAWPPPERCPLQSCGTLSQPERRPQPSARLPCLSPALPELMSCVRKSEFVLRNLLKDGLWLGLWPRKTMSPLVPQAARRVRKFDGMVFKILFGSRHSVIFYISPCLGRKGFSFTSYSGRKKKERGKNSFVIFSKWALPVAFK